MSLPGRFVDTSAGRVFVHRQGPRSAATSGARPVVLIHGFMMSHWVWKDVIPLLVEGPAAGREVVAIDLPGFGESDRPRPGPFRYDHEAQAAVVDEVLAALELGAVDLVGHSMGGGVALTLAATRPARVARLALVSAAILPLPLPPEGRLLLLPRVGPVLWNVGLTRREMRRLMRRDHFRDQALVSDQFVDYYWSRVSRPGGKEAAYAALQAMSQLRHDTPHPEAVQAPTLLVWPEEDRVVPLEAGRQLASRMPRARLEVVPAAGHNVQLERPAELVRLLTQFLDEKDAAAPASEAAS